MHEKTDAKTQITTLLLGHSNRVLRWVTITLYIVFILIGFFHILLRYIFNQPVAWVEQLSRFLFIWSIFLGSALVIGTGDHIILDFFVGRLPLKTARYLALFSNLIVIVLLGWLYVYDGSRVVRVVRNQMSPALGIPMTVPYLAIPVGGFFMLFNLVVVLLGTRVRRESVEKRSEI